MDINDFEDLKKAKKQIEKYITYLSKKDSKKNKYFKTIENLRADGYIVDEIHPESFHIRVLGHKKTLDFWTSTGTISGTHEKGYQNLKKNLGI